MKPQREYLGLPRRWRLLDQSLKQQFFYSVLLFAGLIGAAMIIMLVQIESQSGASRDLTNSHIAIDRMRLLSRDFYRQQTLLLEYLRTRNPELKEEFERSASISFEGLDSLNNLVPHQTEDPEIRGTLGHLADADQAWRQVLTDLAGVDSRGNFDSRKLGLELTLAHETFLTLERLMEKENRILTHHEYRAELAVRRTSRLLLTELGGLFFIFLGLMCWILYSAIFPLIELAEGISRYQSGEFSFRTPVRSRSEVGFLQAAFNEMAEKTEAMISDLKRLDEMKTDFISTVSHELRTPLTSIGGYAKLLLSEDAGAVTDTQREFLDIIDKNVDRLTQLINDILDVEKMESGHVQVIREPQDIVSVLKEARDTFSVLAVKKGVDIIFRVPLRLKAVLGERRRLVQVFMNLLSNAVKYTEKGFVEISAEQKDFAVIVKVRDTGVGMTSEEQENLFKKFYRTRSGLSSGESGTGLGLVIARGLVEAHGGTITVESSVGEGTTFTVALPVAAEEFLEPELEHSFEERSQVDSRPFSQPGLIRTIWIIDEDKVSVAKMKKTLESEGTRSQRISTFQNLSDIPEDFVMTQVPSLIIADPHGVHVEGEPSLIAALRKKMRRKVPILVVSAAVDPAIAFAEGASGLLTKPIDDREFLIATRDLLAHPAVNLLVVDSNPDVRILLKRGFEQQGLHVDDLDRGNTVLNRLEQGNYDLVLLDSNLSDVSSAELLKVIRREAQFKTLPIFVMLDEEGETVTRSNLAHHGVTDVVDKRQGITSIVETISGYLSKRG